MPERKVSPQLITKTAGRAVTGVFSVFGNIDSYGDVVQPGAFTKTLSERGGQIFHLWQHDFNAPAIAVVKDLRELRQDELPDSVKTSHPDATGGAEVTREYLDTARGNEILAGINAGVPYQMSFAFDPIKVSMGEQNGTKVRFLHEVRMFESSDVLWGANDATRAVKRKPTTKAITAALRELKAPDDWYVAFDGCYDLAGGANAFASVAYLLGGEANEPDDAKPLISALRLLLEWMGSEVDEVEAALAAGQSNEALSLRALVGVAEQIKAGARHGTADMKLINAIHQAAVDLGSTQCKGIADDTAPDESRAEPHEAVSLTLEKARLFLLNY